MRRSLVLLLLLVVVAAARAQTRQAYHTTLLGHIDPAPAGVGIRYSALTGYVAPDGREYAIVGADVGTYVVDVTGPELRTVSFIPGANSIWREMKTYGSYAYVVSEGTRRQGDPSPGLQIIDLSHLPDSATLVRTDRALFQTAHTIDQQGTWLYINGTDVGAGANGGTIIYDVATDPLHPKRVGAWTGRYVHDAVVRNDTLYAAAINDGQLDIVYLGKDRTSPRLITEIRYPNAGTHNADLTTDGSYVMTTDEVNATPKTLKVWDIRDMENISKVADYTPVPGEVIHNVHTKGNLAIISWYTAGTRIVDISDPRDPVQVGFFDTYPGASSAMDGNWETYPYLPSGKILAGDMQTGLYVFTFDGARRAWLAGTVRDQKTGQPVAGARVSSSEFGFSTLTDASGRYRLAGAADSLALMVEKEGYYAGTGGGRLTSSGGTVDFTIRPLEFADADIAVHDSVTGEPLSGFSWRFLSQATEGSQKSTHATFTLVKDSSYAVLVGAWGYQPKLVRIGDDASGGGSLAIDVPLARGYVDDVELDLGWSLAAPEDDATSGRWERGIPIALPLDNRLIQPGEDATPGMGDHAFITGITGSLTGDGEPDVSAADVDNGATSLTSPAFDLTGYGDPVIDCSLWYVNDANAWVDDSLMVLISGDDGQSWRTLATIPTSLADWTRFNFHVREVMEPGPRMRFRVVAADRVAETSLFGSLLEAGLDDFSIVDAKPATSDVAGEAAGDGALSARAIPNPLVGLGTLELRLPSRARHLRVELFDVMGRRAALLFDGTAPAGMLPLRLDASALASGRYTWRATLDDGTVAQGPLSVLR